MNSKTYIAELPAEAQRVIRDALISKGVVTGRELWDAACSRLSDLDDVLYGMMLVRPIGFEDWYIEREELFVFTWRTDVEVYVWSQGQAYLVRVSEEEV